ncbi:MAG: asparaginase [Clostridia bacterium]|nr:asparaginase [Clostridia bacterium]
MNAKRILLILTGGTICSFATANGEQASDTAKAQALIISNFRKSDSPYSGEDRVQFTSVSPLDVLSENMTPLHWDVLIRKMRAYDYSSYDGVIILHGTDTLAYTASLLSIVLSGLSIPVIMVSSQLALYNPNTNGNANFKAAVELIVNGIKPNVYAVYRNETEFGETTMYVHYAAHLMQCANHSNNFYSKDMAPINSENAVFDGMESLGENPIFQKETFDLRTARVLKLQPYVGLDYSALSLDGVAAVLHGTYHSSTVATAPYLDDTDCSDYSLMRLKEQCDAQDPPIPLFIEPYVQTTYETTGDALRNGILPIENLTSEMAYVKTLVGCALGYRGDALYNFIKTNVNNEFLN